MRQITRLFEHVCNRLSGMLQGLDREGRCGVQPLERTYKVGRAHQEQRDASGNGRARVGGRVQLAVFIPEVGDCHVGSAYQDTRA